ncbi:MAG: hypothetical protein HKO79_09670 [Desulfobacterales bacterium]|nr:hypothetical protein [Deltaproteobacteria bacterium]NNL42747.1 hypothetical protein [Desulfobacterales bacterium]
MQYKINTTFVLTVLLISFAVAGCTKDKFEKTNVAKKISKELQVVGYGYAKIPGNSSPSGKILARQRAAGLAASSLVDQISGIDFVLRKVKGKPAAFKTLKTSSRGVLKNTQIKYYNLGNNRILAKQVSRIKISISGTKNTTFYETSFRSDNLQKSLLREYRNAVQQMASAEYKKKNKITGKIMLSDMNISDYKGKSDIKVKVKLFIIFN